MFSHLSVEENVHPFVLYRLHLSINVFNCNQFDKSKY